jgi:hypothetical protein
VEKERAGSIPVFLLRSSILHAVTYFAAGILFSSIFDYRRLFDSPIIRDYMRAFGSPEVAWGPWLQPLRGLLLGAAILPFRSFLAGKKAGWIYLWLLFLGLGIVGTPAASPASFEGLIYSKLPLWYHLVGLPEICLQTLAYSWLVHLYLRHPKGLVRDLPPVFGSILGAIAGGCFAFMGYAVASIAFAYASGSGLSNAEGSMNLRTQGLFIAPFLLNGVLVFSSSRGRLPIKRFLPLLALAYPLNALAVAAYQGLFYGGISAAYVLLAPLLPAAIVAAAARPRAATEADPLARRRPSG